MGINISPRTDYSSLFQSLSPNKNANLNFLSDYYAVKNGSYGKLMKAYYAKDGGSKEVSSIAKNVQKTSTSADSADTLTKIERAAESLNASTDKLMADKAFENKDAKTGDLLSAVKSFTEDYNSLIQKADGSNTSSILKKAQSLVDLTYSNESSLNKLGITINDDLTLSIDEEKFKGADINTAKSLFTGSGSYAYSVSSQAMLLDYQANYESIKANTYTASGTFGNANLTGSLFDSMF